MSKALGVLRGAATGFAAGSLVFGVVLLIGMADSESGVVFAGGAVAASLVCWLSRYPQRSLESLGAVLVGLAAVAAGISSGFGLLEYSVIVGSALAAAWSISGQPVPMDPWAWFRWGGVVIPVLVIVLLPLILDGGALGHDESAYGLKAMQWLEGTPGSGWAPHRGTGMSAYGYVVLALGGEESALRLVGLFGAGGLAVTAWALANRMATPRAGALASVGVVAAPAVLHRGTEYLSDLPAAALLVLCMVIVWNQFGEREVPGYRVLWFLVPAWGAFYLRYQSALSLVLIALFVFVVWGRKVRRRPGPVIWLGIAGMLGLIPHFVQSIDLTGTPWRILLNTSASGGRERVGEGLADYAGQLTWQLGGYVLPIALLVTIAGLIGWWRSDGMPTRILFLLVPAAVQVGALGLISHGEPRFVFFPVALVVVAGAIVADHSISHVPSRWTHVLAAGLSVLVVGSLALSASYARTVVDNRRENNEPVELAAMEVAREADGATCAVLTSYAPQITFYSRCSSRIFLPDEEPRMMVENLSGDVRFLVLIEGGKSQPTGEALDELIALTDGSPVIVTGEKGVGSVFRFAD